MKILQVTAGIAPRDGGPTTATLGLNRGLNSIGVDALIVSTDADGPTERIGPSVASEAHATGARALVLRRSRPYRFKNSWAQGLSVWQHARSADIVHVHGIYLAHSVWAFLAARYHRRPYTVQLHGTLEPYQRGFGRPQKLVWDRLIGRRILRQATALVAASDSEARNLRTVVPGSHVIVMPLGVTPVSPRMDPDRSAEFEDWLSVPRHRRVLFLGRLATKKRPDLVISAWQRTTSDSRLAVVGPAQDWTHAELRALASPQRAGSLTVSDGVDPPAVSWLMSQAGIFMLPSENENFGIAVAEAMLNGCAVITTAQTAAADHVRAADAGIVIPDVDTGRLVEALENYLTDAERTAGAGRCGARYAETTLTWRSAAQNLTHAYHDLIAARSPRNEPSARGGAARNYRAHERTEHSS